MSMALPILDKKNIKLQQPSVSKDEVITATGNLLLEGGYVQAQYIDSMHKRDEKLSVYLGSYLAIPHGEFDAKQYILHSGIVVLIYPNGIDWNGEEVKVVIGIAGKGDDHMEILSNIARVFSEEENIETLVNTSDVDIIYNLLT